MESRRCRRRENRAAFSADHHPTCQRNGHEDRRRRFRFRRRSMIRSEQYAKALKALQRLIVHAKAEAYQDADSPVAKLLNDVELLPEYLADETDRTEEFIDMLQGIAQIHPSCRYIVEEFESR